MALKLRPIAFGHSQPVSKISTENATNFLTKYFLEVPLEIGVCVDLNFFIAVVVMNSQQHASLIMHRTMRHTLNTGFLLYYKESSYQNAYFVYWRKRLEDYIEHYYGNYGIVSNTTQQDTTKLFPSN